MPNTLDELLEDADPELLGTSREVFIRATREQEGRLLQVVTWLEQVLPPSSRVSVALAARLALVKGLQQFKRRHVGTDRRMVFISPKLALELYMASSHTMWESAVLDAGLEELERLIICSREISEEDG